MGAFLTTMDTLHRAPPMKWTVRSRKTVAGQMIEWQAIT
jgi:hypothetical protein